MAIEEQSFLTEISSLLMNLIKVIDPSKLQEVFISCSAVDKIIGRILSEEMTDDDWRILSDILLFILPLSIDCNAVIQQLQILRFILILFYYHYLIFIIIIIDIKIICIYIIDIN